ncbi:MAG TPA: hypothetical protein DCE41_32135 [Cytophagales bacterium]|nr:hypothetical protein [Cytophagales bacterium]HAA20681.1 hypothetical protein [Cytophagales bacterium]HAP58900.1 hypothetical protein [Cytophagales bacterium]
MAGPSSTVTDGQKKLQQNHALLHKERGFRSWMPTFLSTKGEKKKWKDIEASPEVLAEIQSESEAHKKRHRRLVALRLGAAVGLIAVLWYAVPPLLQWLFPPI